MTDLTDLTLAEARDGLQGQALLRDRADARACRRDREGAGAQRLSCSRRRSARSSMAQGLRRASRQGRGGAARRACRSASRTCSAPRASRPRPARTSSSGFVPPYESTVTQQLWRDGAVMLGKLNNDEFAMGSSNETSAFGPVVSPWRRRGSNVRARRRGGDRGRASRARRLLGRLGGGGRGAALPRRDRDRHRRLDPPAGRLHRHRRHQADLRPLLALGHRRLRLLARPGRADRPHGARLRHPAALDGRATTRRTPPRPTSPVPDFEAAVGARRQGPEDRHPEGIPARRHAGRRSSAVAARARRG